MNILKLSNMTHLRTFKNNEVLIKYYYMDKEISCINYNIFNGQIKYFNVNPLYQNKGLGKQILNDCIMEMDEYYNKEIWCISCKNHLFWNNVYNKSFQYRYPIQSDLPNLSGFYMKL
jgi:hypothetical protein